MKIFSSLHITIILYSFPFVHVIFSCDNRLTLSIVHLLDHPFRSLSPSQCQTCESSFSKSRSQLKKYIHSEQIRSWDDRLKHSSLKSTVCHCDVRKTLDSGEPDGKLQHQTKLFT